MTHILENQLQGVVEEVDKERTFKEVSESTLWEQSTNLAASERRSTETERARVTTKKRVADLEGKLGDAEEKLAHAEGAISAKDKEIATLMIVVVLSQDKFYNMGFVDVENSSEPIMLDSRCYGFEEGLMATVNALGLPEDSPFKHLDQIPLLEHLHSPLKHTPAPNEKEDSLSMRELVEEIDSHTEVIDLNISTHLGTAEGQEPPTPLLNPDLFVDIAFCTHYDSGPYSLMMLKF